MNKVLKLINIISLIITSLCLFLLIFGSKTGERGMIVVILIPLIVVFLPVFLFTYSKLKRKQ